MSKRANEYFKGFLNKEKKSISNIRIKKEL